MLSSPQVAQSDDSVIPSNEQIQKVLIKSHNHWQQYIKEATEQPSTVFDCIEFRGLIDRTPAIPPHRLLRRNGRAAYGQSTWHFSPQDKCSLGELKGHLRPMILGITNPTICTTEGSSFRHWGGDIVENPEPGNGLAILVFAWAYILSARLVELQGGSVRYTEVLAPIAGVESRVQATSRDVVVDLENVDSIAARWWRAILAHGQGWRATVHEHPVYLSPWSVSYQGSQYLQVNLLPSASAKHTSEHHCPSSTEAMGYLADFCAIHHLHSQSSAALAAALVLPLHELLRQEATLPEIVLVKPRDTTIMRPDFLKEDQALPYLMTLSCTARMLDSAIWGVFWEPGVDCNLVSAWFRPIINILTPIIKSGNFELLAKVMALRDPKLSPLWLGSIITGITPRRIIPFLEHLDGTLSGPDLDVVAWTSSPQSFIDLAGSGPYVQDSKIRRADVWRLRYICQNEYPPPSPYRSPPLTGWPPFGSVPHTSVDLEVWLHTSCNRHERLYSHWDWIIADGTRLRDYGFNKYSTRWDLPPIHFQDVNLEKFGSGEVGNLDLNEEVSEDATKTAFAWAIEAGYNPEIDKAFNHPWLSMRDHDEDSDASSIAESIDAKDVSNGNFSIGRFLAEQLEDTQVKRANQIESAPADGELDVDMPKVQASC
ncbi:uncharacterized protein BP5553_10162 [Venustampulla echinocandica]|uniref:Uncharacterized protein n=1 Tax=Venustampulla echinocandica TaxID=2656787 RepID=A0A370TAH6_9HELO|nr:uncharacterized protein BP5553_10162 [Venustampulla echinocandica]RDL30817.1 hypothetical protein BP5553_10162 [Venustampulla echinocandica]